MTEMTEIIISTNLLTKETKARKTPIRTEPIDPRIIPPKILNNWIPKLIDYYNNHNTPYIYSKEDDDLKVNPNASSLYFSYILGILTDNSGLKNYHVTDFSVIPKKSVCNEWIDGNNHHVRNEDEAVMNNENFEPDKYMCICTQKLKKAFKIEHLNDKTKKFWIGKDCIKREIDKNIELDPEFKKSTFNISFKKQVVNQKDKSNEEKNIIKNRCAKCKIFIRKSKARSEFPPLPLCKNCNGIFPTHFSNPKLTKFNNRSYEALINDKCFINMFKSIQCAGVAISSVIGLWKAINNIVDDEIDLTNCLL